MEVSHAGRLTDRKLHFSKEKDCRYAFIILRQINLKVFFAVRVNFLCLEVGGMTGRASLLPIWTGKRENVLC
jgi:hypothetical protein